MPLPGKAETYTKIAMTLLSLVVPFAVLILMQSLGELKTGMAHLEAEISQLDQIDDLKERIILLEQGDQVISHAQLSSNEDQYPTVNGDLVSLNFTDSIAGALEHDPRRNATKITVREDGGFFFVVAAQVRRLENYDGGACLTVWLRVNGRDLANSSVKQCFGEGVSWRATAVLVLQAVLELDAGEYVQIMHRSDPEGQIGMVAIEREGVPLVPSAIVSVLAVGS